MDKSNSQDTVKLTYSQVCEVCKTPIFFPSKEDLKQFEEEPYCDLECEFIAWERLNLKQ